jgi:hypothetical protein
MTTEVLPPTLDLIFGTMGNASRNFQFPPMGSLISPIQLPMVDPFCTAYGYCNSEFSVSSNGTWLALAPFYDDMTTQGGSDPLGTSIKYLLSGTAPNQILTIEWVGMAVYGNTSPNLNFQVKLYETSGRIEFYLWHNASWHKHIFLYGRN